MIRTAIALVCLLASSALADTKSVTVEPGVSEIRIAAPAEADISWESRQPLSLRYITHTLATGESAIVFCATAGSEYVIVSDVIDWTARDRIKTTWLVTVSGKPVDPIVDPDDPPDDPDPPLPDTIPNKYGIGPAVYAAAARLPDKSAVSEVSKILGQAETALNQSRYTAKVVMDQLQVAMTSRHPGWSDVLAVIVDSASKAAVQYGAGSTQYKNYLREARLTVELLK